MAKPCVAKEKKEGKKSNYYLENLKSTEIKDLENRDTPRSWS